MKTKEQKIAEVQSDLEKKKKRTVWRVVLIILVALSIGIGAFLGDTNGYNIITIAIMFCFILALTFPDVLWNMNMGKREINIKEKIDVEAGYLKTLKDEYEYLCVYETINEIPRSFKKTAIYLLSDSEKSPREIINMREEEVEDLKIQLQVYQTAPERTFWDYFISKKWLKKVVR